MTITRTKKDNEHPYTMASNSFIYDCRLSLKSKALLLFVLSRPPSWAFNFRDVLRFNSDGIKSVRNSIRELSSFGYVFIRQYHRPNGDFDFSSYFFFETSQNLYSVKTMPPAHSPFGHTLKGHTLKAHSHDGVPPNLNIVLKTDKITTSSPTKVVNTKAPVDVSLLKKHKDNILKLFGSLGIINQKNILAKYNNSDILKYASWMDSRKPNYGNATSFLISAVKEKWDISQSSVDTSSSSGPYIYKCEKCLNSFKYSFSIPDYDFCNACLKKEN